MDLELSVRKIDYKLHRYPFCLVWTPIPLITWILPFIGHMGIATSQGIIRDFPRSYYVGEDNMYFAWPTRYIQLDINKFEGGTTAWDDAVEKSSTAYSKHIHNLVWYNCHSHCGMVLSLVKYGGSTYWGTVKLAAWMFLFGKYVGFWGFVKTWLPFVIIVPIAVCLWIFL